MSPKHWTRPLTIIIDGPSGAGKTWLANYLAGRWRSERRVTLLHMDDLYGGWGGLAQASDLLVTEILPRRHRGEEVSYRRWDWAREEWKSAPDIPATSDLIIEGCGSLREETAALADFSLWITADEKNRKKHALARGGEDYESHWDEWDAQFRAYVHRHTPQVHASLVVRSTR